MKYSVLRITALLLMLTLGLVGGRAQSAYDIFSMDTHEGLADALTQDVVSDNQGRLWIGTESGLNCRNDDGTMTLLTRESGGLTSNVLRAVYHDRATDRLLVGSMKGGLCVVDCSTAVVQPLAGSEGDVARIVAAADGGAWAVYYKGIVRHYDFKTNRLRTLPLRQLYGLDATLRAAADDGQGCLYVGTSNGVYAFHLADSLLTKLAASQLSKTIAALWVDPVKNLWVGTTEGLMLVNTRDERVTAFKRRGSEPAVIDGNVRTLYGTPDGQLWVGADPGGICVINVNDYYGTRGSRLPLRWLNAQNSQLSANCINRLGGDDRGRVFVSMSNVGCDILTPSQLPFFMLTTSAYSNVAADADDMLWGGGTAKILRQVDGREWKIEPDQYDVIVMTVDSLGRLWMGSNYKGVVCFDPETEQFTDVGIKGLYISIAYADADGTVLIGTENGLYAVREDKHHRFMVNQDTVYHAQMTNHTILGICRDRLGQLWLCTKSEGIYVFGADNRLVAYLHEGAGLPSDFTGHAVADSRGRVWIGTAEGLVMIPDVGKPQETVVVGTAQGMANARIQAIAEDNDGRIWCSTFGGITCYDPDQRQCYNFDSAAGVPDGLLASAVATLSDGSVCFGSKDGICSFRPAAALDWLAAQASQSAVASAPVATVEGSKSLWWIAGVLLLVAAAVAVAVLLYRRKRKNSFTAVGNVPDAGDAPDGEANQPAPITVLDQQFLDRLTAVIEQNLSTERLDKDFLTAQMGMSQSALYRKVKALTGLTTNEFIRNIRMTTAARLLKEGHNASETAYLTGFNSPNLFRKYFKDAFGVLPSEYGKG